MTLVLFLTILYNFVNIVLVIQLVMFKSGFDLSQRIVNLFF